METIWIKSKVRKDTNRKTVRLGFQAVEVSVFIQSKTEGRAPDTVKLNPKSVTVNADMLKGEDVIILAYKK